jgi:hypothetical protein
VYAHLELSLHAEECASLRWVAQVCEKPGWDIEYTNAARALIAIEVKGTSGPSFPRIEITAGEWEAAQAARALLALFGR